jgi:TRAP-type transport system periplasmic protein
MDSLGQGKIDGATSPPSMLFEFGIGRLTSEHLLLETGGVPTALIMNRKKFESLPPEDQALILKYSGDWLDKKAVKSVVERAEEVFKQMATEPLRTIVSLSPADLAESQRVFDSVINEWGKARPGNRELLALAREELANYRNAQIR